MIRKITAKEVLTEFNERKFGKSAVEELIKDLNARCEIIEKHKQLENGKLKDLRISLKQTIETLEDILKGLDE